MRRCVVCQKGLYPWQVKNVQGRYCHRELMIYRRVRVCACCGTQLTKRKAYRFKKRARSLMRTLSACLDALYENASITSLVVLLIAGFIGASLIIYYAFIH